MGAATFPPYTWLFLGLLITTMQEYFGLSAGKNPAKEAWYFFSSSSFLPA